MWYFSFVTFFQALEFWADIVTVFRSLTNTSGCSSTIRGTATVSSNGWQTISIVQKHEKLFARNALVLATKRELCCRIWTSRISNAPATRSAQSLLATSSALGAVPATRAPAESAALATTGVLSVSLSQVSWHLWICRTIACAIFRRVSRAMRSKNWSWSTISWNSALICSKNSKCSKSWS